MGGQGAQGQAQLKAGVWPFIWERDVPPQSSDQLHT